MGRPGIHTHTDTAQGGGGGRAKKRKKKEEEEEEKKTRRDGFEIYVHFQTQR
jgi:hypothetical protein